MARMMQPSYIVKSILNEIDETKRIGRVSSATKFIDVTEGKIFTLLAQRAINSTIPHAI